MGRRSILGATIAGITTTLLLTAGVLADTCCPNTAIDLEPTTADPGDTVEVRELRCLASDFTTQLAFEPVAFWLWPGERAAASGADTPGPGLPEDLPPSEAWLPFDGVSEIADGVGSAVITVPDLPDGSYQLWWRCEEASPGGGIHYSSGPRLVVGAPPDTSTTPDAVTAASPAGPDWPIALVLLGAATAVVGAVICRTRESTSIGSRAG